MLITAALDRLFRVLSSRLVNEVTFGSPMVRTTPSRVLIGSGKYLYETDGDGVPRIVYPLGAMLDGLAAGFDKYAVDEELRRALRDVADHVTQVNERVDSLPKSFSESDVKALANEFKVSEQAMTIRLTGLGLI